VILLSEKRKGADKLLLRIEKQVGPCATCKKHGKKGGKREDEVWSRTRGKKGGKNSAGQEEIHPTG